MKTFYLLKERYSLILLQVIVSIIFFVPLMTFSNFYFPFITPRNFIFRILVEVLLLVYIVLVVQNTRYLPSKNAITISLTAFVGLLTLASIFGVSPRLSFWSTFERMEGLINLYHLYVYFIILYSVFREKVQWERLMQCSIFVAVVMTFIGLSQLLGVNLLLASSGGERISATTGNATYLAAYLLIHFFFVVYFIIKARSREDIAFFKYAFIALDVVLIFVHLRFGTGENRYGIISQIFSHPGLWIPFVGLQLIALSDFFREKMTRWLPYIVPAWYGALGLLFIGLITTTQTRGAIVGFGLSFIVACIFLIFRRGERRMSRSIAAVCLLVIVAGAALIFLNRDSSFIREQPLLSKIASISLDDATTRTRLATWEAAFKGFRERPVLGWGVENFHVVFNKYFPVSIYTDEGTPLWFDRPHNLLIQYLVEGGIVSLAAYIAFIFILSFLIYKRSGKSYIGILWIAFLIAYIGQNLFVFDSINSYIPFYFAVGFMAFLIAPLRESKEISDAKSLSFGTSSVIIAIGVGITVAAIWGLNVRAIHANRSFVSLYKQANVNNFDPALADRVLEVIKKAAYLGRAELLSVYSESIVSVLQARSAPDYEITPVVEKLAQHFEQSLAAQKNDARFYMFLMNFYLNAAYLNPQYLERLLQVKQTSLDLSPTRPQLYYLSGRAHMMSDEYEEGTRDFEAAVRLAPWAFDAHWNMFAAYVGSANSASSTEELTTLKSLRNFDPSLYLRVASIYASGNDYPSAERELLNAIVVYPESSDLYAALADVYAAQGKDQEAREAVTTAVELEPALKKQADQFIELLEQGKLKRVP